MGDDTYHMSWGTYAQNATTLLANLINESDFTDVTLVCEGGKYIKAHRVILSGSSYFFNNFIRTITHQNPVVYLSGIAYEDLQAILELIYLGKTEVVQANLENFVKTAEKLKIIGLTEDVSVKNIEKPVAVTSPNQMEPKQVKVKMEPQVKMEHKQQEVPTSYHIQETKPRERNFNGGRPNEKALKVPNNSRKTSYMSQFSMVDQKPDLPLLSCEKCPYTTYDSERLNVHVLHTHPLQYYCNKCNYKTSSLECLKNHKTQSCDKESLNNSVHSFPPHDNYNYNNSRKI